MPQVSHPLFAAAFTPEQLDKKFEGAEKAMVLLRGIIGTMWGMAAALRNANRPTHVSATMWTFLLRCLAFRPERTPEFLERLALTSSYVRTREEHAAALRTASLGVLSCCVLKPEFALQPADLAEIEKDVASRKLQSLRRGQIRRRQAAAQRLADEEAARGRARSPSAERSPETSPATACAARRRRRRGRAALPSVERAAKERRLRRHARAGADGAADPRRAAQDPPTQLLCLLEELIDSPATRFTETCAIDVQSALLALTTATYHLPSPPTQT